MAEKRSTATAGVKVHEPRIEHISGGPLAGGGGTGSAVLLPEGEAPTSGTGTALSSVGMLAMALRFNEERPGHSMLLAGHADSVGSDKSNDKLSTQRAELTRAVLTGNREKFVEIASETGKVSDWKQIFKWSSAAFPAVPALQVIDGDADEDDEPELPEGFALADPGKIDDNAASGKTAALHFQEAYNRNRATLGGKEDLKSDGVVGKKTWGAVFDLYQYNLAQELGEDFDSMGPLRNLVTPLPSVDPFLGFGESSPIDGIGKDNLASEANRRVELLFFEQGQEPDLGVLGEDPKISELYQAEAYEREAVPERPGGAKRVPTYRVRLLDVVGEPMKADSAYSVRQGPAVLAAGVTTDAWISFGVPFDAPRQVEISWGPVEGSVRFHRRLDLGCARRSSSRETTESRLRALGYAIVDGDDASFVGSVRRFQQEYTLPDDPVSVDNIPKSVTDKLAQFFERDLKAPRPDVEDADENEEAADA